MVNRRWQARRCPLAGTVSNFQGFRAAGVCASSFAIAGDTTAPTDAKMADAKAADATPAAAPALIGAIRTRRWPMSRASTAAE